MGRIIIIVFLGLLISGALFIGGSYLVVFWRDTTRRWRLEKEMDRKRQISEAKEEFLESAKVLDEFGKKDITKK